MVNPDVMAVMMTDATDTCNHSVQTPSCVAAMTAGAGPTRLF